MAAQAAPDDGLEARVAAVRAFHRLYTRRIGLLHDGYLGSPYSLTEARVLYELAHRENAAASEIARDLELDPGYLSRTLRRFREHGLVDRAASTADGRRHHLSLTDAGHAAFAALDGRSHDEVEALLRRLSLADRGRLGAAMETIQGLLDAPESGPLPLVLRPPRPGDLGWVVQRHGAIYAREYGWDETFEALVAEIVAGFVRGFDPERERCWIAEVGGRNVGSVFCVRKSESVGQLRLLLVEPDARGQGLGARLVDECVAFARSVGYGSLVLWTNDVLVAARRIYEAAGFRLVEEDHHHSFGHDLVGQSWELTL